LELLLRNRVVLGHVITLAQPVVGVGCIGAVRVRLEEILEQARRLVVAAALERVKRRFIGRALVGGAPDRAGIAVDRGRRLSGGRGGCAGGGRRGGRDRGGVEGGRAAATFVAVEATVQVQVLSAAAGFHLLNRALQFLV